jgi:hypothetical protein
MMVFPDAFVANGKRDALHSIAHNVFTSSESSFSALMLAGCCGEDQSLQQQDPHHRSTFLDHPVVDALEATQQLLDAALLVSTQSVPTSNVANKSSISRAA